MAPEFQPLAHRRSNDAFKSAGDDRIEVKPGATSKGATVTFHATAEQTNGACLVTEFAWGPDDSAPHHFHRLEDEGFYVIEGSITLHSPEGDMELEAGEFGWAPRHVRHAYTTGPEGARVLLIQTPGTLLSEFFRAASDPGDLQGEGEFEGFADWTEQNFGVTILHPAQFPPGRSVSDSAVVADGDGAALSGS